MVNAYVLRIESFEIFPKVAISCILFARILRRYEGTQVTHKMAETKEEIFCCREIYSTYPFYTIPYDVGWSGHSTISVNSLLHFLATVLSQLNGLLLFANCVWAL